MKNFVKLSVVSFGVDKQEHAVEKKQAAQD